MGNSDTLRALLVDPALFTAPYDAALNEGLGAAGVQTRWATRGLRQGETAHLPGDQVAPIFYPGQENSAKQAGLRAKLGKGLSHFASSRRLVRLGQEWSADLVHFQWSVLPAADLWAMRRLKARGPVVLTVHDTTPFNDNPTSRLQVMGFGKVMEAVDHVIVHTTRGKAALQSAGCASDKISVIPHGPFEIDLSSVTPPKTRDPRWTYVLFGRLQSYKGADILVEALSQMPAPVRARLRVIVAGEPFMDLGPLQARSSAEELPVEWRLGWITDADMAALMVEADAFLFPYRRIEASGVYFMTKTLRKWIIASDLGAFGDEITPEIGALLSPGDPSALAQALAAGIGKTPAAGSVGASWAEIGQMTAALYQRLLAAR